MRAEIERFRAREKAEFESGARQSIGATVFSFDTVKAAFGHETRHVRVGAICWVYRRQITHWLQFPPLPVFRSHHLVIHAAQADGLTWEHVSFTGSKREVHQSIVELMKRVPWALFGYYARSARGHGAGEERHYDERNPGSANSYFLLSAAR